MRLNMVIKLTYIESVYEDREDSWLLQKVVEKEAKDKSVLDVGCGSVDIEMEIGDLLFSIVNLSRFLNVDSENALRRVNEKFIRRFKMMEAEIERQGKCFEDYDLEGLDEFWEKAKEKERDAAASPDC